MMNQDLNSVLKEIKEKECSLHKLPPKNPLEEKVFPDEPDMTAVISFLIYARYTNYIDFDNLHDENDVEISLNLSKHKNASNIVKVWKQIKGAYPYTDGLLEMLHDYDLAAYRSEENDKVFSDFMYANYLLISRVMMWPRYAEETALDVICSCGKQLGIDTDAGNILVSIDHETLMLPLLKNNKNNRLTFTNCGRLSIYLKIAIFFMEYTSGWQYVDTEDGEFFPFDDAKFDGIYYMRYMEKNPLKVSQLIPYIKDGGFCVAFNQPTNNVGDEFYKYEIPLVLDTYDNLIIVCKKQEDKELTVRYGECVVSEPVYETDFFRKTLIEGIKNNGTSNYYQTVRKDDFRYAQNDKRFTSVRRERDQFNFVWRDLKDIIKRVDCDEPIITPNIGKEQLIEVGKLSSNPFKIKVSKKLYLTIHDDDKKGTNQILKDCSIERIDDDYYSFEIPEKYAEIFEQTYDSDVENEETRKFDLLFACRLITKPALLCGYNGILRVAASPEHPVCIRKVCCFRDEDFGYDWACSSQVDEIEISPEYDENFIIYQYLKANHHGHILVAPTKEEQRTYFINKQQEYLAQFKPVVDEMEEDVRESIAKSNPRITGVGFKNFRRFSALSDLPLKGVTIFVGGNNAGKSTVVKGLLLALDNLKALTMQNEKAIKNTNDLRFQLDANNIHDVHIGTFSRAYTNTPLADYEKKREITFMLRISHFAIGQTICPQQEGDDISSIPITRISLKDEQRNASFVFDYGNKKVFMKLKIGGEEKEYEIKTMVSPKTGAQTNIVPAMVKAVIDYISSGTDDDLAFLNGKTGFMLEMADELESVISNAQVEYIYAHGINQKVLFNYNDRNDFMAMTLHDLENESLTQTEHDLICQWLETFGIGKDYDIHSIGGEAYSIQIKNMNGNWTYLADMGMGASQLVALIFRLVTIIHRQLLRGENIYKPTVIIEEPEQNMHPAFQTKLADLFYEMHRDYGFNFIVETHSEYLVRKTQVLVKHCRYKDKEELNANNPFLVYYFPSDENPREMEYRPEGDFTNEFGPGFYDEAGNLLFDIL